MYLIITEEKTLLNLLLSSPVTLVHLCYVYIFKKCNTKMIDVQIYTPFVTLVRFIS